MLGQMQSGSIVPMQCSEWEEREENQYFRSFSLELPQQMPELIGNTPFQQAEYLYHLIQSKE